MILHLKFKAHSPDKTKLHLIRAKPLRLRQYLTVLNEISNKVQNSSMVHFACENIDKASVHVQMQTTERTASSFCLAASSSFSYSSFNFLCCS